MNTLSFNGEGNVLSFTQSGDNLIIKDNNGITISTLTDIFKDLNTQLTTEEVQDIVGDMVSSNTETNISVTYNDTNAKLNFVATDTNTQLTTEEVQDIVGGMVDTTDELTYSDTQGKLLFNQESFYDVKFCNFTSSSSAKSFFIPFTNSAEFSSTSIIGDLNNRGVSSQFIAAYPGEIVRICFRSEIKMDDLVVDEVTMKLCEAGPDQELVATDDTQIGDTYTSSTTLEDDNTLTISPTNWVLTQGNSYGIFLRVSDAPRDTQISVVFKYTI